jgi:hypothetical protein
MLAQRILPDVRGITVLERIALPVAWPIHIEDAPFFLNL